jgi:fructokinase
MARAGSTKGGLPQLGVPGGTGQGTRPLVVSWGELLWDLYPDAAHLGGASANVAYHAARIGAHSALVSRVGKDSLGERALAAMSEAGVDVTHVTVDPERATGHVHVTLEQGEPRFRIGEAVAWDRIEGSPELSALLDASQVFCFGTLAQRTPQVRGALMRELRRIGVRGRAALSGPSRAPLRLLDLNLRPPFADEALLVESATLSDVVKLNEDELSQTNELCRRLGPKKDAVAWLLEDCDVKLVTVTRGARGATFFTRHVRIEQSGFPSSGLDPVGAGDAFAAVLAVGLSLGKSLPEIAEAACRHAAWVASRPGAQPGGTPERGLVFAS